jgi:hypothetical protein
VRGSERLGALCGVIGPIAFTAAWLVAARRQDEYLVRHEHITGLAPSAIVMYLAGAGLLRLARHYHTTRRAAADTSSTS